MRALVQHYAFGAVPHRGVRDLGAGRHPFLGKRLQNLCRPDHGDVGGLADPEDLLLNFRQSLEAALDGLDLESRTIILKMQPRMREELLQGLREEGPEGYEKFVRNYFKRLAKVKSEK